MTGHKMLLPAFSRFTALFETTKYSLYVRRFTVSGCFYSRSRMKSQSLRFTKLSDNAYTPTRGSQYAAGYDLYSAYDYIIPPKGKLLCMTDLVIAVPQGSYGRIAPRSGLAVKNFIDVGAGVVDQDYRGNVGVVLFNFGDEDFHVKKGDRIAQLICEKIFYPEIEEVVELDTTKRGTNGFGSSGKN